MQDTCIYQAPVEVGELWKKKKYDTPFSECSVFYYYYVFVALRKNTFAYKEPFIVSYQTKH